MKTKKQKNSDNVTSTLLAPNVTVMEAVDMLVGRMSSSAQQRTQWCTYTEGEGMILGILLGTSTDVDGKGFWLIRDTQLNYVAVPMGDSFMEKQLLGVEETHAVAIILGEKIAFLVLALPLKELFKDTPGQHFVVCISEEELMEYVNEAKPLFAEIVAEQVHKVFGKVDEI